MKNLSKASVIALVCGVLSLGLYITPTLAHHSFAMYDQTKVITLTGVTKQFVAQANHAELHFYKVGPDGKPEKGADGKFVEWGIEMAGAAAVAQQGITTMTFRAGVVFSVHLNPLRDGSNFGSRQGALAKCPTNAEGKTSAIPAPGKHCDSVAGMTLLGGTSF